MERDLRLRILGFLSKSDRAVDFFVLARELDVEVTSLAKELDILVSEKRFVMAVRSDSGSSYEITPSAMEELKSLEGRYDENRQY